MTAPDELIAAARDLVEQLRQAGLSPEAVRAVIGVDAPEVGAEPDPWMQDSWDEVIEQWSEYQRAGARAESTIRLRRFTMLVLARESGVGPWDVTGAMVTSWVARGPALETKRSRRQTVNMFYRWAIRTRRYDRNPADELLPIKESPGLPRPATDAAIRAAIVGAAPKVRLMIHLGAMCGLRRAEIAGLHTDDVTADGRYLLIRGKGRRMRRVPLPTELRAEIAGLPPGWVFPSSSRPGMPISPDRVGQLVTAGLGGGLTAHQLRHRYATVAYAAERDILAVQRLLGHSKPETTARYADVPDGALQAAAAAAVL